MLVVLFVAISIVVLVIDMIGHHNAYSTINRNRLVWICDVLVVSAVVIIGAYTGIGRMRYMIDCLEELKQLNEELKDFRIPTPPNDRTGLVAVSSLLFGVIIVLVDYAFYFYKTMVSNGRVIVTSFYIFFSLSSINLHLLVVQFLLITTMILAALKDLNSCFEDVLHDLQKNKSLVSTFTALYTKTMYNKDSPTVRSNQVAHDIFDDASMKIYEGVKSAPRRLNRLVRIYCIMFDLIQKVDRSHGPLLVMLLLSFLLHLIITLYHLLIGIGHPEYTDVARTLLQVPWVVYQFTKLVMVIEPCHRTHDQLANTKDLVTHMTRYIRHDDFAIIVELKTFFRHLALCRGGGGYEPMQLFTLNRTVLVTMISSITTYLIIIVQM